jgi:SnoaL-like polyketide cyclase
MPAIQDSFAFNWFENVWNQSNESAIDQFVDEHAIITGLEEELVGPAGFKLFYHGFRNDFRDIHVTVTAVNEIPEGELAFCRVTAVHKNSGVLVDFIGQCRYRLQGGKIIEATNEFDFESMRHQLAAQAVDNDELL